VRPRARAARDASPLAKLTLPLEDAANTGADVHLEFDEDLVVVPGEVEVGARQRLQHPALDVAHVKVIHTEPGPHDSVADQALGQGGAGKAWAVMLGVEARTAVCPDPANLQPKVTTRNHVCT